MKEEMLIGALCRKANCTPRTIRHYEKEGLLAPVSVTPGGRKLYGDETVSVVFTVRLLKLLGYSLKDIRRILALTKSGDTRQRRLTKKIRKLLTDALSGLDRELDFITSFRDRIADLMEATGICDECNAPDCNECGRLKRLRTLGLLTEDE